MPTNNSAALFFKQFSKVKLNNVNQGIPCTITSVKPGGFRVDVAVSDPVNKGNVAGHYVERNVPFVADGHVPPPEGYFVTSPDYAFAAASVPSGVTVATATTGGTLPAGTQTYRISAIDASGETAASAEASVTTTGTTSTATPSWTAEPAATGGFNIYGRTAGSEQLLAHVAAGTTSWTDDGSLTPNGALPTGVHAAPAPGSVDEDGTSGAD